MEGLKEWSTGWHLSIETKKFLGGVLVGFAFAKLDYVVAVAGVALI
jgi:hypothetical protein